LQGRFLIPNASARGGAGTFRDKDLAELYEVETKVFNQAIKRRSSRFPDDFLFQLSVEEVKALRSQTVTLKRGEHRKYLPYAFTENGVAMLSSVLNSERAVQVNIQIMRAFTRLRAEMGTSAFMLNQLNKHEVKLLQHDRKFEEVFRVLDDMQQPPEEPKKKKIGFTLP
jgi:phage regulator Rha-like protein